MKQFSSKLLRVRTIAPDVLHLDFEFSEGYVPYEPGQFFIFKFSDAQGAANRSYSISSHPKEQEYFSLTVKLEPGGRASEVFRNMQVGDAATFMAPFGHFVLAPNMKHGVMVATGTGLAPFMSMLTALFDASFSGDIALIFGVRHEDDLFYMDELNAMTQAHSNFKFIPTVSQPSDAWTGAKGRVTEHVPSLLTPETDLYICGNGMMVKSVKEQADSVGLPKTQIHLEQFNSL